MERFKKWSNMGEHAAKALKIVDPYYTKNIKGGGYTVYAPAEKNSGGGVPIKFMSAVKKCKTEKQAKKCVEEHILAISQSIN